MAQAGLGEPERDFLAARDPARPRPSWAPRLEDTDSEGSGRPAGGELANASDDDDAEDMFNGARVCRVARAVHAAGDRVGYVVRGQRPLAWLQNFWCQELFSGLLWDAAEDSAEATLPAL